MTAPVPSLDIPVAILAGGLATRMRPLTEKVPKVLLPVAGRSFFSHQLDWLRAQGIQRAVVCLGHLGEMVVDQFGDGRNWGVALEYSFDGAKLLGTGGALRKALPLLGKEFFVLYGDSYLTCELAPIARCFRSSGQLGLMTVYHNRGLHDTSNVVFRDGRIAIYDKKAQLPEMHHIDYGLSLLNAVAFDSWPADQAFDLADLLGDLVKRSQLAGYEVPERFYEIGSPTGFADLERLLQAKT